MSPLILSSAFLFFSLLLFFFWSDAQSTTFCKYLMKSIPLLSMHFECVFSDDYFFVRPIGAILFGYEINRRLAQ